MKFNKQKRAYTLAEIMLVILLLTIVFAALAPIITKRRTTQFAGQNNVWSYANYADGDAQYDPGDPELTGQLFFGVSPTDGNAVKSDLLPFAKLVIRAGDKVTSEEKIQRHIQFRYGRDNDDPTGKFAGSWYVDNRNMLLGGAYVTFDPRVTKDNAAIGYNALNSINLGTGNTAIGYYALASTTSGTNLTAIGYNAGREGESTRDNVYIGHNAGRGHQGFESVYIGYNAGMGNNNSGKNNLAVGAYAGGGLDGSKVDYSDGKNQSGNTEHSIVADEVSTLGGGDYNTAVGYQALANVTTGQGNIAIGAYALKNLTTGHNNVAIGYNACSNITIQSNKTCIGYNSGPRKKGQDNRGSAFMLWDNYGNGNPIEDTVERVYIGSAPVNFGGDAVLELHNPPPPTDNNSFTNHTKSTANSNTTTVINGNLIVNGRPYFTVGGNLYHFQDGAGMTRGDGFTKDPYAEIRFYGYRRTSDSDINKKQEEISNNVGDYTFSNKFPNFKTSDRRLKNIGERFQGGLNELKQLKVYNYTFKTDKNKLPQVGVIAQELQKIFPTAVAKGEDGYLRIRWDEIFFSTINAIKELDKRIIALVNKATKVESKISKLEKENIELQTQVEKLTERVNKLKTQ